MDNEQAGAVKEALDLEAIRKRCEAATPGPWYQGGPEDAPRPGATELSALLCFFSDEGARFYDWMHDGEFVAHAREDVPALLAEVERLRASLAALTEQGGWRPIEERLRAVISLWRERAMGADREGLSHFAAFFYEIAKEAEEVLLPPAPGEQPTPQPEEGR